MPTRRGVPQMRWLDDRPPPSDVWFLVAMYLIAAAAIFGLVWIATGPAKSAEPPAWLVPTVVMLDGTRITGAQGWHPRRYPSTARCEAQAAVARLMTPPAGADRVLWQCLPFNPLEGPEA